MNLLHRCFALVSLVGALSLHAQPALVGPAGYSTSFETRPPAAEWSSFSFAGGGGNNYNLTNDVQTLTAAQVSAVLVDGAAADPPAANALAAWTSGGSSYVMTRPTGNRFSVLMASLQNTSGSNVTSLRLQYDLTVKAAVNEPDYPGLRAFYSLSGAAGTWVPIPEFSTVPPAVGSLTANITFAAPWSQSNMLFVLWADDNANAFGTDPGYAIDNFSVAITGGSSVRPPVTASITSPANDANFFGVSSITINATADAPEHTVTNVAFFANGVKIGDDATAPYSFVWNNPPLGPHTVQVVASDELGVTGQSALVNVTVYDAGGSPFARITSPTNGFVAEGPTNLVISAFAVDAQSVTNVEFYANGTLFGSDDSAPYSATWSSAFGSNGLRAVAVDSTGLRGTSEVVVVNITIPPTNTVAPVVATRSPIGGATVSVLTSVSVVFSERVQNVNASDLLINGTPAAQVTAAPGGSNYTFTFPQPAYGTVNISWAADHGITDFGFPSNLAFDHAAAGANWTVTLVDQTPPTILTRTPAANATVSNLTQVSVTFSEPVTGVDAADFLVNGAAALSHSGAGANYTFSFSQPPAGLVNISWATEHGIVDTAANAFNAAAATWSYTLDTRVPLVQSNATWRFIKGLAEASTPTTAWREPGFDDSSWSNAPAPFFFGDPYSNGVPAFTHLTDMQGGYTTIYLRKTFNVVGASAITNLFLNFQIDDGMVVWINGTEVLRFNAPAGEVPYNGVATASATEPGGFQNQRGAGYILTNLLNAQAYLVDGENVMAVLALNQSLTHSSDFGFNAQLSAIVPDFSVVAPAIAGITPAPGSLFALTNITVRFTEGVSGVDASDLLVNGVPATSLSSSTNTTYSFTFAQPAFGPIAITWASGHGIADLDSTPKPFNATAPGSTFNYTLINPSAPTVAAQSPLAGSTMNALTQLTVSFSEPVTGVNASDLLVNGAPASGVSGGPVNYTFTFTQPAYGTVSIGWAGNHGITDTEPGLNAFDGTRTGNTWTYTLVDQTAPAIASISPLPGSLVTNLTQVTVTFSEAVVGVDASDLRVNGLSATSVSGSGASYTFTVPQQNATLLNFSWLNAHGIRDTAPIANAFNAGAPNASWSYTTPDTLPPSVAEVSPTPFITLRSLNQLRVTFSEAVTGVDTNDLLVNGSRALAVSGSGAGPYTFTFIPASNGVVNVQWAANTGIRDLATPAPNTFGGGEWSYVLDPAATFAGKVVISEIMFNPLGGRPAEEWIELRNVTGSEINLAGWRFSRGVNFTFPNLALAPHGYLVVAANVAAFQSNYPGVTNVIGGWTGSLANSDENVELETALGESVARVHYATEGDWARRERGHGAELVESIVRNGSTATVRIFGHGYTSGGGFGGGTPDIVLLSGADQPEYNGLFTISAAGASTFNITVSGTPASPATGNIISRHAVDEGISGWSWFSAADGFGSSLELINPALDHDAGQNWLASTNRGGTPGRANSTAASNIAPLIRDVTHFPVVPRSSDAVTITARVRDEFPNGVAGVQLFWRDHTSTSPAAFTSTNMFDDGAHGDGLNRDGLFGAVLPAMANGTVIEFYVRAIDTNGLSRTWPAPTWETNNTFAQLANALYQVDDEVIANPMPAIRLVMTGSERAIFPPNNRNSDAEMNVTFINTDGEGTQVRYFSGVRVRGAGSRTRTPPNNRVNIPNDNRWNDLSAVNLNGQFVHAQVMGSAVARKSGVPASEAHVIQYRINGVNPAPLTAPANGGNNGAGYGAFLLVRPVNGDLAESLFPLDGDGNVYRASSGNHSAQFVSRGNNPDQYLADGYFKTSNQTENDWTDLASLSAAFSNPSSEAEYLAAMSTNANVEVWMRYFAMGTLLNYGETSMFNGRGDDYALYRGVNDPRFVPIGHDFDTVFGQGDAVDNAQNTGYYPLRTNASLFIMMNPPNGGGGGFGGGNTPNIAALRRFMTNETFAPIFFREVQRLAETVFSPNELNPLFDQLLADWGNGPTATTIQEMKTHAQNRRSFALSQIPLTLTVNSTLATSNGFLYTTSPTATLFGQSHAIDTRRVLVNGLPAARSAWEARWTNTVTLQPGVNRVLVQSLDSNNVEFARATVDIWYDDATVTTVSGPIASDTVWSAAQGPYQVTANVTVQSGATLTIQPGTTVYLNPGVSITVANGGRLLAEGTDAARILFSNAPGSNNWGGIVINGGVGAPETRIAYAHITGNNSTAVDVNVGGELFMSHVSFGNTAARYLDLDGASFVVQDCHFPTATVAMEPIHGSSGIKPGGRGIFQRCFIGRARGYNDAIDFTGGNRPGPILQVLNCVFLGSDDDLLDLDSTDAWVEGNIFLHTHRNGSPDSASAVSGGSDNADNSHITIVNNLFYDVDHAVNAKQTNFYTLLNNTIVRQTKIGSQDTNTAVIILADMNEQGVFTSQGAGVYLEGNIIVDAENLTRHLTNAIVTYTNNIIHRLTGTPWTGLGGDNTSADPLFVGASYDAASSNWFVGSSPLSLLTSNLTSWSAAQVLWDHFALRSGSPALATGPLGRDKGAVASGIAVFGEPVGATPLNTATLRVGPLRTGNGIPTNGFPNGSGFTHYRWRLDGGAWSAETPVSTPISLTGLSAGPHYVEVSGRNDAGFYQDDAVFGPDARVTVSRTWIVDPNASVLRLNEVLAANSGAFNHAGTTPDAIELFNAGDAPVNLAGYRLTDELDIPDKFIFPAGTTIPARGYLVVYADNAATPGIHLGFGLSQDGDALHLFAPTTAGGALLDSVTFGMQLENLSIGRLSDGSWTLTQPTFGAINQSARLGDPRSLRINEWLALGGTPNAGDFVELVNLDAWPVALGGLYLSDEVLGWPTRHPFAPLSFIGGNRYLALIADGNASAGADHLNFRLSTSEGAIGLFMPDLSVIDCVWYQPQRPNISQGRSPNGGSAMAFFTAPTPGAANPLVSGPPPFGGAVVINEVLAANSSLVESGRTPDWVEIYNGTTNAVDLADFSLTDNPSQPRKFVFSPGATIAPGGFLRVLCDPNGLPGPLATTNFALGANGGRVFLFTAAGAEVSSIAYGIQTPDLSIGRVPDGSTNWTLTAPSPATANFAVPLDDAANLRINEWMADPASGDDWFEIYNPNNLPVALGPLAVTDDLNNRLKHRLPALSFIGNGTNAFLQLHASGNVAAGAHHVSFSLRAGGEALGIAFTNGAVLIDGITFGSQATGVSEGRFPNGATNILRFAGTVSPGEANWRLLTNIVINEVLTHTDSPLEDAIELHNLTAQPVDVGGWWLSDDEGALQKYQIPGPRIIPPFGFTVIYENQFTNAEIAAVPFAISSRGDEVVLSAYANNALTGFRTKVDFGAAPNGESFGRYVTSDGRSEFVALSARTFGQDDPGSVDEFRAGTGRTNAPPRVGPVVVSEIMYHPIDLGTNDNTRDEFIELRNITTAPVALFDGTNGWRLRDAVDFEFPIGTVLPAGGDLIVVSFDPVNNPAALAAFRAAYNIASSVPIVGPWSGRLSDSSDDLELRRPGEPDTNGVDYILVERVRYFDAAPWPIQADGSGFSLHRVLETAFANEPANWRADAPTPGPLAATGDTDGDGLPDFWENLHGLDPRNSSDAALDSDGDGLTNLQEFQLGTDPRNAASGLRIGIAARASGPVLTFLAVSNTTYSVMFADAVGGTWQLLQAFSPAATNRTIELPVNTSAPGRFYRLLLGTGASSELRINSILPAAGGKVTLHFTAPANTACVIRFAADLGQGWTTVTNMAAAPTNRTITVTANAPGAKGFFRLSTP